ncbi:MAG TPA: ATP phosphoribosyltransferase, partial [Clostridiales bacterium]|nr:ATP phosphoribosyltransferase [Clostridiales bacterium]
MLNIALPKGRLGSEVYELFSKIGYVCQSMDDQGRKLVFEDLQSGIRYL